MERVGPVFRAAVTQLYFLRKDQVAALVQTLESPAAVIRRLADSAKFEADAHKSTSSAPSANDSNGLATKSVSPGHSSAI
eukprot:4348423-Pleurochrysis_carterae.AAC.1